MRKRAAAGCFSILSLIFAVGARAADGPAIAGRVGTLGIGPEATLGLTDRVHLRFGLFAVDYGHDVTERGITYDGDLELRNGTALIDWYPTGAVFRVSAGAAVNDNELVGTAPLEDFVRREVPGLPPLAFDLGTLRGTATADRLGPYLGIGFGNPFRGGRWGFALDLGLVYQGEPDVDLAAETSIPISLIPGGQARLDRELAEEEEALEDEAEDYTWLPVLSIGLTYSF